MKNGLCTWIVWCAFCTNCLGQITDWKAVQQIAPGTRISVKTRFRTLCDFVQASSDTLTCLPAHQSIGLGRQALRFERSKIRDLRFEHSDGVNMVVGGAVGAGTGAAIGAIAGGRGYSREGTALLLGSIGGLIGGSMGQEFPIAHGKEVYRRPPAKRGKKP